MLPFPALDRHRTPTTIGLTSRAAGSRAVFAAGVGSTGEEGLSGGGARGPCWLTSTITEIYAVLAAPPRPTMQATEGAVPMEEDSAAAASAAAAAAAAAAEGGRKRSAPAAARSTHARWAREEAVLHMTRRGLTLEDLSSITYGVALPLREALSAGGRDPPVDWPEAALMLVGRQDVARLSSSIDLQRGGPARAGGRRRRPRGAAVDGPRPLSQRWPVVPFPAQDGVNIGDGGGSGMGAGGDGSTGGAIGTGADGAAGGGAGAGGAPPGTTSAGGADAAGLIRLLRLSVLRFGRDRRMSEVCRLLRSDRPVPLRLTRAPEISDHDLVQQQQQRLEVLCKRTLALPTGRGMLTLGTLRPMLTEALPMPPLALAGRVPSNNATMMLDTAALGLDGGFADWPQFSNGVAAGLRVSPGQTHLTRTWIVYNKPASPTPAHAGFVMALGMQVRV